MLDQLPQLLSLCPPPLIHIHDPHQHLPYSPLLDAIRATQKSFVSIDCTECISPRVLFARIINGLANWTPSWSNAGECWGGDALGNWDASFDTFSKAFEALWRSIVDLGTGEEQDNEGQGEGGGGGGADSVVIMLLNSERLKDFLPNLLVPLTRLSELTSVPACVIFVSQCSWIALRPTLGASPNPFLCTTALTSAQITDYLLSRFPTHRLKYPIHPNNPRLKPLYEQFIQTLYAACSPTTNEPAQLAYVASACWPGFVTPLLNDWRAIESSQLDDNGDVTLDTNDDERFPVPNVEDTLRLLHTFKPTFLPALNALLPRLTTAQAWNDANTPPPSVRLSQPLTLSLPATTSSKFASTAEQVETRLRGFTTRTRILLLASYVASFNPARTDASLFERTTEGVAKRAKRKRKAAAMASPKKSPTKSSGAAKLSRALTGPSAFPLERLLAIYEALLIEHIGDEVDALEDEQRRKTVDDWAKEVGRAQLAGTVSQLIQTQLLRRTSSVASEVLDGNTQFKSNVSYELAVRIAKGLKLDLADILWDIEQL